MRNKVLVTAFATADVASLVVAVARRDAILFVVMLAITILVFTFLQVRHWAKQSIRLYASYLRFMNRLSKKRLTVGLADDWGKKHPGEKVAQVSMFRPKAGKLERPLYAPVRLLRRNSQWPDWAFDIAVKYGGVVIDEYVDPLKRPTTRLSVHLREDDYGIYSNEGKKFLFERFAECKRNAEPAIAPSGEVCSPDSPFRWASGGALPIVEWRNKRWVALFFRDLDPVGWNLANGASESRKEQMDIQSLIFREFAEELVVLRGSVLAGGPRVQKQLKLPWTSGSDRDPMLSSAFSTLQRRLRDKHDGVIINESDATSGDYCPVWVTPAPFEVRVRFGDQQYHSLRNVVFTINPTELGIEVLHILRLELADEDVLIDGEILESGELARRPVLLIEFSYLSNLWASASSIGEPDGAGGKVLPPEVWDHSNIFNDDTVLRRRRVQQLAMLGRKKSREYKQHKRWLKDYEDAFDKCPPNNKQLRTLCPAAWKSIELVLSKRLLSDAGGDCPQR